MDYISAKEAANKWGVSDIIARKYCRQKRIPGAKYQNGAWLIPEHAKKPKPMVSKQPAKTVSPLFKKLIGQKTKKNNHGLYDYIQINFTYKLGDMKVSQTVWERGQEYYMDNHVRYICVDDGYGRAIVEGERAYEVEFKFADGEVSNLICSCPCGYTCKHEVAAMMQLKETLELIAKHYADLYNGYFAAIVKSDLFRFAIDSHETGSFTL